MQSGRGGRGIVDIESYNQGKGLNEKKAFVKRGKGELECFAILSLGEEIKEACFGLVQNVRDRSGVEIQRPS